MKQAEITHTGSESPYFVMTGLMHRVQQAQDILSRHPERDQIIQALFAGKLKVMYPGKDDGSVTVHY